jgi:hypothetical protein
LKIRDLICRDLATPIQKLEQVVVLLLCHLKEDLFHKITTFRADNAPAPTKPFCESNTRTVRIGSPRSAKTGILGRSPK